MSELAVPDLDGLWSCAVIGRPRWWSNLVGGGVLTCLVGSWLFGFSVPALALALAGKGYVKSAGTLLSVTMYPYFIDVPVRPMAARFWLLAAHWFGGCSMSYEKREPNDLSVPQMNVYFPHGMFTLGLILNSGIRTAATQPDGRDWDHYVGTAGPQNPVPFIGLAVGLLVKAPIFGHIVASWTGCIKSVSKGPMLSMMRRGESFGLTPGGFHEASAMEYGKERVMLSNKKGFIKYALQYGYKVVPAYSFGESFTYYNVRGFKKLRMWLSDRNLPGIAFRGFAPLPWLPFHTPWGIHTIHGSGRQFPKIAEPTAEDVDKYHELFIGDLRALFDRHKHRFGQKHQELEVL